MTRCVGVPGTRLKLLLLVLLRIEAELEMVRSRWRACETGGATGTMADEGRASSKCVCAKSIGLYAPGGIG